jgi:thioredoxin 1
MKTVIEILGADFESEIRTSAQPVLVLFYTSWCGQCQILAPPLTGLARELEGELQVAQVNLDHSPELAGRYDVVTVPSLILFQNGVPIECFERLPSILELKARLQGALADYATGHGV